VKNEGTIEYGVLIKNGGRSDLRIKHKNANDANNVTNDATIDEVTNLASLQTNAFTNDPTMMQTKVQMMQTMLQTILQMMEASISPLLKA
jgi:hypothetical protein